MLTQIWLSFNSTCAFLLDYSIGWNAYDNKHFKWLKTGQINQHSFGCFFFISHSLDCFFRQFGSIIPRQHWVARSENRRNDIKMTWNNGEFHCISFYWTLTYVSFHLFYRMSDMLKRLVRACVEHASDCHNWLFIFVSFFFLFICFFATSHTRKTLYFHSSFFKFHLTLRSCACSLATHSVCFKWDYCMHPFIITCMFLLLSPWITSERAKTMTIEFHPLVVVVVVVAFSISFCSFVSFVPSFALFIHLALSMQGNESAFIELNATK